MPDQYIYYIYILKGYIHSFLLFSNGIENHEISLVLVSIVKSPICDTACQKVSKASGVNKLLEKKSEL